MYYVISTAWDDEKNDVVHFIEGQFSEHCNAEMFKEAFNNHWKSNDYRISRSSKVVDENDLLKLF